MDKGYISLHRKFLDWEWHDDAGMVSLWVQLLLLANHEPQKWHGMTVGRGQLITSYGKLMEQTGLSEKQLRNRLQNLVESGCMVRQTTNKYSLITICNYGTYQDISTSQSPTEGTQRADKGHSEGTQRATNNNEINITTTTTNASAYVREEEKFPEAWADIGWRESVCMKHKFTMQVLENKWEEFVLHCKANGKPHDSINDVKYHFNLWLYNRQNGTRNQDYNSAEAIAERQRGYAAVMQDLIDNGIGT